MIQYYDTNPVHPYLCLREVDERQIRNYIEFLSKKGIIVNKLYEKPKYPASDGITYEYLLRLNYQDPTKRQKPDRNLIEEIFRNFTKPKSELLSDNQIKLFEEEKKYFKQVKSFLNSEKKAIEIDRQFLKDQLVIINNISQSLKSENDRIFTVIQKNNDDITREIKKLSTGKSIDDNNIKLLEQISEKENLLNEQAAEYAKKLSELDEEKNRLQDYRIELEQEKIEYINNIRNLSFGIDPSDEEDSIQDLKILVFGESKVGANEIFEIFNNKFVEVFKEELNRKCVEAILLSYKDVKNSNINAKIKSDKYDYIIVGPHDHSSKGKSAKQSYLTFVKENKLRAIVNQQNDNPLNKETLSELAEYFINHWESQFEILE